MLSLPNTLSKYASPQSVPRQRRAIQLVTDKFTGFSIATLLESALARDTLTPLLVLRQKDHRMLVHAIAILYARGLFPQVTVTGTGDAEQKHLAKIRALVSALGLNSQIHFKDFCPAPARLPSQHQICVITTDDNEMPEAMIEAMAAGCPVIGSSVETVQDLIADGIDGHLIPPQDPQALAAVLEKLLRNITYAQQLAHTGQAKIHGEMTQSI